MGPSVDGDALATRPVLQGAVTGAESFKLSICRSLPIGPVEVERILTWKSWAKCNTKWVEVFHVFPRKVEPTGSLKGESFGHENQTLMKRYQK